MAFPMQLIPALLFSLTASFPLNAATMDHDAHGGHGAAPASSNPATAETSLVDGTVKKVDKAAGKVTVSHAPLTNLNMPAMTMVFRVKEAVWLDQMQVGSKIRFVADSINGVLTIVQLDATK